MAEKASMQQVKMVPFNQIAADEVFNIREILPKVKELADQISAAGMIVTPLAVTNGGDGDKPYQLRGGYRRHAALKSLKWGSKEVPVVIFSEDDPMLNVMENSGREPVHPLDLARRFYEFHTGEYPVAKGVERRLYTPEEIAAHTDRSVSAVRNLIRVHEKIAPEVRKAARAHPDVPLRLLIDCAGYGEYVEVESEEEEGKTEEVWEPNKEKQLALFSAWREKKEELETLGQKRSSSNRGSTKGGEDDPEADNYGFAKEKIKGKKNILVIDACIRVLTAKKGDDPLAGARAEGLRFARGEITRLPGVTKSELEAEIEVMKSELAGDEGEDE